MHSLIRRLLQTRLCAALFSQWSSESKSSREEQPGSARPEGPSGTANQRGPPPDVCRVPRHRASALRHCRAREAKLLYAISSDDMGIKESATWSMSSCSQTQSARMALRSVS